MDSGSANVSRMLLSKVTWSERTPVHAFRGWLVYLDPALAYGVAYIDISCLCVVVRSETWDTLRTSVPAMEAFLTSVTSGSGGIKEIPLDSEVYAEAIRLEAAGAGDDVARPLDVVSELEQQARRVLLQATAMRDLQTTDTQVRVLNDNFMDVVDCYEDLRARLRRVYRVIEEGQAAIVAL